jgi:hypothetical protein
MRELTSGWDEATMRVVGCRLDYCSLIEEAGMFDKWKICSMDNPRIKDRQFAANDTTFAANSLLMRCNLCSFNRRINTRGRRSNPDNYQLLPRYFHRRQKQKWKCESTLHLPLFLYSLKSISTLDGTARKFWKKNYYYYHHFLIIIAFTTDIMHTLFYFHFIAQDTDQCWAVLITVMKICASLKKGSFFNRSQENLCNTELVD